MCLFYFTVQVDTSTNEAATSTKVSDRNVDNTESNQVEKTSNEKSGKKKAKAHITAKEYEEITQLLLFHLKQLEEDYLVNPATSEEEKGGDYPGCRWKDLTAWYISKVLLCFDFSTEIFENSIF